MSFMVHYSDKGRKKIALIAQLSWAVLNSEARAKGSAARKRSIRSQAARNSATRYTLYTRERVTHLGMYTEPLSDASPTTKNTFSIAAAFLAELRHSAPHVNAMLLMAHPHKPEKRILVVLEGGQIAMDVLVSEAQANTIMEDRLANLPDIPIFTNCTHITQRHSVLDWPQLEELAWRNASAARLLSLPAPPWLLPAAAVAVLVVIAGALYHFLVWQPAQQRALAQEVAKLDKTPAYVVAADQELAQAGWAREDLAALLQQLRSHPVFIQGWVLERIACDTRTCTDTWARRAGTVVGLAQAMPQYTVDVPASTVERSVLGRAHTVQSARWTRDKLLTLDKTLLGLRPVLQDLQNAGVTSAVAPAQKWAGVDFVGVLPQSILMVSNVDFSMPLHRAAAALSRLPESVLIKSFSMDFTGSQLTITFKGSVYANQ